jgi:DNA-binding transcriptional LysR family regulator
MKRFNLTELQAFVTLAEHLHFGRTAELLHVTQPALSKQIQRLEETVGGQLVARGYRDVRLTEAGHVLLTRARLVLQESSFALDAAHQAVRGELGVLRIGFGLATIEELLPEVLVRFRAKYPGVELRLQDMPTPTQVAALAQGQIDVGFVRLPVTKSRVHTRAVLRERLVLAYGAHGPWHPRGGLASLAASPFVTIARATSATFHDHVLAVCRAAGFTPKIVQETNELFTMLMLVRAGMGVALAPRSATARRPKDVRFKDLSIARATWDIGVAWSPDRRAEPVIRAFLDLTFQLCRCGQARPQPG